VSATDRRALLRLGAAALLLPLVSVGSASVAAAAARFAPPEGPMRYSRRLERGLAGGASFVVSRGFAVRFRARDGGFHLDGEQVAVECEAPEALAAFARIERERVEQGLFPMLLDTAGRITGTEAPMAAQIDAAVREAIATIDRRPRDPAARAALLQYVNAIHQSAGRVITELPRDLFAPPLAPRSESRAVALPDGGIGQVRVTFAAAADPVTGLMRTASREVVTELEGDERRTVESWRLEPLG